MRNKLIKVGALLVAVLLMLVGCGTATEETQQKEYVKNELVNQFINDYQETSTLAMEDIQDSAVSYDGSCTINGCYVTLSNTTSDNNYNIEICIDEDYNAPYDGKMYDVAKAVIKVLDKSIKDEALNSSIDELKSNEYAVNDFKVCDKVTIYYFLPTKELSEGTNPGKIRIQATYGK